MRIKITSTDVETKSGIAAKSKKPYTIHQQKATAENARFRMPVRLTLGEDENGNPVPHAVGEYEIDFESSVSINQYGDFGYERQIVLVPLTAAKKAA